MQRLLGGLRAPGLPALLVLLLLLPGCGSEGPEGAGDASSGSELPRAAAPEESSTQAPESTDGSEPVGPPDASAATGPRVVFLGTSLTAGLGVARDAEAYPARLDRLADSAGLPIRVANAGVSGETSAGGLRRLPGLLEDTVDVLFLELGANDGLRGHDPAAMESNLRAIVEDTRAAWPGVDIVLAGLQAPPNMGPRYTRDFRAVFPRLADELDLALVPFLLERVAGVPELNQGDRIHPTAEGHAVMARTAWPVLEAVLRRRSGTEGAR